MQVVTVSPNFQIAIPSAVREALHLKAGQKMILIETIAILVNICNIKKSKNMFNLEQYNNLKI